MKRHKLSFAEVVTAIVRSQLLDQRRVVVRAVRDALFVLSLTNGAEHKKLSSLNFHFKRYLIKMCHPFEGMKTIVDLGMCETSDALGAKLLYIERSHHGAKDHRSPHRALVELVLARE